MPSVGFEPTTNGLCLPLRLSPRPSVRGLWSGLSLRFTRLPSSLYTFRARAGVAWLGITVPLSRLRLPRIWQILRAHLRRVRRPPELECDTLATLLCKSYGKGLRHLRSAPYRQAVGLLLAPMQERFHKQQTSKLCLSATTRPSEKAASDSTKGRTVRAMWLPSQRSGVGLSSPRTKRQILPPRHQALL